jgi:hypothetical protein
MLDKKLDVVDNLSKNNRTMINILYENLYSLYRTMPKISKSKNTQVATQIVKVNVIQPEKQKKKRNSKKGKGKGKLNTGPNVTSGLFLSSGGAISDSNPSPSQQGVTKRDFTDTYLNQQPIYIKPEPGLPRQPIDQNQAFDYEYGIPNAPSQFNENNYRRTPQNMEDIPIPLMGLYPRPFNIPPSSGFTLADRMFTEQQKMESGGGGGGGYSTPKIKMEGDQEIISFT